MTLGVEVDSIPFKAVIREILYLCARKGYLKLINRNWGSKYGSKRNFNSLTVVVMGNETSSCSRHTTKVERSHGMWSNHLI